MNLPQLVKYTIQNKAATWIYVLIVLLIDQLFVYKMSENAEFPTKTQKTFNPHSYQLMCAALAR